MQTLPAINWHRPWYRYLAIWEFLWMLLQPFVVQHQMHLHQDYFRNCRSAVHNFSWRSNWLLDYTITLGNSRLNWSCYRQLEEKNVLCRWCIGYYKTELTPPDAQLHSQWRSIIWTSFPFPRHICVNIGSVVHAIYSSVSRWCFTESLAWRIDNSGKYKLDNAGRREHTGVFRGDMWWTNDAGQYSHHQFYIWQMGAYPKMIYSFIQYSQDGWLSLSWELIRSSIENHD